MKLSFEQIKSVTVGALSVCEEADGFHFCKMTPAQIEGYGMISAAQRDRALSTTGVRLDCELYVCRRDIGCDEGYAQMCKEYADAMNQYSEFFFDGLFTVIDVSKLPYYIKRGEFYNADKTKVLRVLYNASNEAQEACGVTIAADALRFDIFDANEYNK